MKDNIVVYWSGGKDSTALILKMIELDYRDFIVIFVDTKIEFEEMYEYVDKCTKYFKQFGIIVKKYKSKYNWNDYFYKIKQKGNRKGQIYGFPFTLGAWCNDRLKMDAMNQAKKEHIGYLEFIGYAIDEKSKIRQIRIKNKLKGIDIFETIKTVTDKKTKLKRDIIVKHDLSKQIYLLCELNLTENDCLNICKKYNLHNPLYDLFGRTGCWCCPKQPISSLRILFHKYPEKWKQLKKWQIDSPQSFKPQYTIFDLDKRFKKEPNYSKSLLDF